VYVFKGGIENQKEFFISFIILLTHLFIFPYKSLNFPNLANKPLNNSGGIGFKREGRGGRGIDLLRKYTLHP